MYLSWWSSNISIVGLIIVAFLVRLKAEITFLIMWLFEKKLKRNITKHPFVYRIV